MTEETEYPTVEERLARVETKTDRLIRDLDESRAETRAEFKELRSGMQDMESRLTARQDEATTTLRSERQEIGMGLCSEVQEMGKDLRTQMLKLTELVVQTQRQLRSVTLMMAPMVVAGTVYLLNLVFG